MSTTTNSSIAPRIFLAFAIIGALLIGVLVSMSLIELSKFNKVDALAGFQQYEHSILFINLVIYAINLCLALWIYTLRGQAMYFVYTLFLFIFFLNLDYFWLIGKSFEVKYSLQRPDDILPIKNILAVVLNIAAIVVTIGIYLIVRAMKQRGGKVNKPA